LSPNDTLQVVINASSRAFTAYWDATDPQIKADLLETHTHLDSVATILGQQDMEQRTASLEAAASMMKSQVLPPN
jgi:hypothetical protein